VSVIKTFSWCLCAFVVIFRFQSLAADPAGGFVGAEAVTRA
jgi:hypothetical protein